MVVIGSGGRFLEFTNNYRAFFSSENPELTAFEKLQSTYTKNDNFLFVIEPSDNNAFSRETLTAVAFLTEEAWQIPHASRVDSLANFQHTLGLDDDLVVEDLIYDLSSLTEADLAEKQKIALSEPLLRKQLVTLDAKTTAVNVTLQYPEQSLTEVPEAVEKARSLMYQLEADYPGMNVSLTGVSMLDNAFFESGMNDTKNLIPLMFVVILVLTLVILLSITATFSTMIVIAGSTLIGMGFAGFTGMELTPISGSAPVVILTLAIAESIHILISLRVAMREGMSKVDAIVEAVRLNFLPVSITSLTTIVGFLALNFSDSPPFWHLGNILAVGIFSAWILSITLLPALISILPYRVQQNDSKNFGARYMIRLANFVIGYSKLLLVTIGVTTVVLISYIPQIEFNDQ
jgi:predicted RND superfamily exporter protein